jgi:hypothetical protein
MALVDIKLDNFSDDEIISYLERNINHIGPKNLNRLRTLCGFRQSVNLDLGEEYQKIRKRNLFVDNLKMEVIINNFDKYDYQQICEFFEK